METERPPVPLAYRPGRDEYETYHPPPRQDFSPPISPEHFSPRGEQRLSPVQRSRIQVAERLSSSGDCIG